MTTPRTILLAFVTAVGLAGCPKDPAVVERPTGATPCVSNADCNIGGANACGLIRACVDERCEGTATRTVRCP